MSREGAAAKLLHDAALWKEHDGWVTYKCNAEQMPRYAMLEAYGSPPIEKAVQAALDAAYAAGLREAAKVAERECVPFNTVAEQDMARKIFERLECLAQQAEAD